MTETSNNKTGKKPHRLQLVLDDHTNAKIERLAYRQSSPGDIKTKQDIIRQIIEEAPEPEE